MGQGDRETTRRMRSRYSRRQRNRKLRVSRGLHRILRFILGSYLKAQFNLQSRHQEVLSRIRPPYLVLCNHTSVWDPFFLNSKLDAPIHYVVSDSQFRSRFVAFGLGLVGSIPKTKVLADLETVKSIVKIKHDRGIIGVFPEGQTSWDGHTLPLIPSTAKLIKSLKVPVIIARIEGAYFSRPRWSRLPRRGKVTVDFSLAFTPEQLRGMSSEEIYTAITDLLRYDAYEQQDQEMTRFVGRRLAEYLERAIFVCPDCEKVGTLHSHRRRLRCLHCGYEVHYNPFGYFEKRHGTLRFETIRAWNLWQDQLDRWLAEPSPRQPFMRESGAKLEIGYKTLPLKELTTGEMVLTEEGIRIGAPEASFTFPIFAVEGMNIQNNERMEFYFRDELYKVTLLDPRGCTYKWDVATKYLQNNPLMSHVPPRG
ncbi:MAG: 1-acyl-sn-glycerol-3-phosphate acyltransferase [Alkalispirochaetaceae bacterium]